MYIEQILKELPGQLQAIQEKQDLILSQLNGKPETPKKGEDALITSQEILKRLNMKPRQRAWALTKTILEKQYGMAKLPGVGYRMTEGNFRKFLKEQYKS